MLCGLKLKLEPPQGGGDDSAVSNARVAVELIRHLVLADHFVNAVIVKDQL